MINIDDRLLDRLTSDQTFLLLHIVKRINADGECWPSTETLRKDTKWSDPRKVRKVRDELVEAGVLEAYERKRDDGGQASNLYRIKTDGVGVFVTAKRLQNLTGGEGKNHPGGVVQNHPGGEGKDNPPPNEVLTIEVLTNEVNSLSNAREENFSDSSEKRIAESLQKLTDYFRSNPQRWVELCNEARVKMEKPDFWDNVKKWVRWNADNYQVNQDPVKALTSGRNNFLSWLGNERIRQASEKAKRPAYADQPQPSPNALRIHRKTKVS